MKWRNVFLIAGCLGLAATLLIAFIRMLITGEPVWIWETNIVVISIELSIFIAWIILCIERAIWLGNHWDDIDKFRLAKSRKKR